MIVSMQAKPVMRMSEARIEAGISQFSIAK